MTRKPEKSVRCVNAASLLLVEGRKLCHEASRFRALIFDFLYSTHSSFCLSCAREDERAQCTIILMSVNVEPVDKQIQDNKTNGV